MSTAVQTREERGANRAVARTAGDEEARERQASEGEREDGPRKTMKWINDRRARSTYTRLLERALEASQEGYWEWDVGQSAIRLSPSWCQMHGLSAGEAVLDPDALFRLLSPEDAEARRREMRALLDDPLRWNRFELRWRLLARPSGSPAVWVRLRGQVSLRSPEGRPLLITGTIADIDEEVEAAEERERAAADAEGRARELEAAFASIPDGVIVYGPDRSIVRMNAAAEAILGFSEEERRLPYSQRQPRQVTYPEGSPVPLEELPRELAFQGRTVPIFPGVISHDGWKVLVTASAAPIRSADGRITGAVCTFSEDAQRGRAEGALTPPPGRTLEVRQPAREAPSPKRWRAGSEPGHPQEEAEHEFVYRDPRMRSLLRYAESIAASSLPVLITGETGAGKEHIARTVHRLSGRGGELVAVNLAGFDDTMFADTLFGHLKGAYTGADGRRGGLVERARQGTLFLDEIGDLRPESQAKLLRLVENREYFPLGSDTTCRSHARLVMATNRNLEEEIARGTFRKDLYYRLRVHYLHVPPLRERPLDLPPLVDLFVRQACAELGKERPAISASLLEYLRARRFPGNIRELKAAVFDAVSRHRGGPLSAESLPEEPGGAAASSPSQLRDHLRHFEVLPTLQQALEELISEALRRAAGKQAAAARSLGISPQALNKRLRRRQLPRPTNLRQ